MNASHFDRWARALSGPASRRQTFLAMLLAGAILARGGDEVAAKKRRRKSKIKKNDFGCVNVGNGCKNRGQCCSGICKGKKGKKKCKAHDTGGCTGEQDVCAGIVVPCVTATGEDGACVRSTGNGGYCEISGDCFPCTKDVDCEAVCGPQAACIVCEILCGPNGTACVGPSLDSCELPE